MTSGLLVILSAVLWVQPAYGQYVTKPCLSREVYHIVGQITDRGAMNEYVMITGKAIPISGDFSSPASSATDINIVVVNPNGMFMGNVYYKGYHCFVGKTVGTNAFGALVPVWSYGRSEDGDRWIEIDKRPSPPPREVPPPLKYIYISKESERETWGDTILRDLLKIRPGTPAAPPCPSGTTFTNLITTMLSRDRMTQTSKCVVEEK